MTRIVRDKSGMIAASDSKRYQHYNTPRFVCINHLANCFGGNAENERLSFSRFHGACGIRAGRDGEGCSHSAGLCGMDFLPGSPLRPGAHQGRVDLLRRAGLRRPESSLTLWPFTLLAYRGRVYAKFYAGVGVMPKRGQRYGSPAKTYQPESTGTPAPRKASIGAGCTGPMLEAAECRPGRTSDTRRGVTAGETAQFQTGVSTEGTPTGAWAIRGARIHLAADVDARSGCRAPHASKFSRYTTQSRLPAGCGSESLRRKRPAEFANGDDGTAHRCTCRINRPGEAGSPGVSGGKMLTDQEIIATSMEPKPGPGTHGGTHRSAKHWWFWTGDEWVPCDLTLDRLWIVEERLQQEARNPTDPAPCLRRNRYINLLSEVPDGLWHATPFVKIRALAAVLRQEVERG